MSPEEVSRIYLSVFRKRLSRKDNNVFVFPFAFHIAVQQPFKPLWSRLLLYDLDPSQASLALPDIYIYIYIYIYISGSATTLTSGKFLYYFGVSLSKYQPNKFFYVKDTKLPECYRRSRAFGVQKISCSCRESNHDFSAYLSHVP